MLTYHLLNTYNVSDIVSSIFLVLSYYIITKTYWVEIINMLTNEESKLYKNIVTFLVSCKY